VIRFALRKVVAVTLVLAASAIAAPALPASATTRPPTALSLVKKLARARLCHAPHVVNAAATKASCADDTGWGVKGVIEVSAFPTAAAMTADLASEVARFCAEFPGTTPAYRVGTTWWSAPYRETLKTKLDRLVGGTIKTYPCP
jgi:hypothetical protein